jgi:hypothetical protein
MSRELPVHPNLDHLRNQARLLLRELKARNPRARLADAQHAVAKEYGFVNWAALKAHVQSQPPAEAPAFDYAFVRYTESAKRAVFFSRYEAAQAGSTTIETPHLLLGLIRGAEGRKGKLFDTFGISLADVRTSIAAAGQGSSPLPGSTHIPFGESARKILRAAVEEADAMGHESIGMAHFAAGILREDDPVAAPILSARGMRLRTLRRDIAVFLDETLA